MQKVWMVFEGGRKSNYSYSYTKEDALKTRNYWQSLGIKRVMIKGRY